VVVCEIIAKPSPRTEQVTDANDSLSSTIMMMVTIKIQVVQKKELFLSGRRQGLQATEGYIMIF